MVKVPTSTYRLQLHGRTESDPGFTFEDAAAIADYLQALGISHVYSSPYLQAAPHSMHGYDVVDHRRVNAELVPPIDGESSESKRKRAAEAHDKFCKRLGELGLGQVLDIVPNHMSLGEENRYWWDVLENGNSSRYASFFDIDWNSAEERLRDKVLVPVLGDQYGRVLNDGGIKVARQGSTFTIEAAGQFLPVAPETMCVIFSKAAEYAPNDTLSFIAASYARLPTPDFTDRRTVLARHRDKGVLNGLTDRLCSDDAAVCEAIDRAVQDLNRDPDALDSFLQQQHFRLAYWRTADQQLGYRRFFDVNTLIGLRVEREYVFDETHALVTKWLREGVLDGVRIDHPDGLRDPLQYLQRLRKRAPEAWIIGEKILEPGEFLRESWPIEGTSGYDFLNAAMSVLVNPEGVRELGRVYAEFTGDASEFPPLAHDKKLAVTQEALGSDVNRLTAIFVDVCESHREQRDFTRADIRRAIREVASCFAIYRTYVVPERTEVTDEDREYIAKAIECAKNQRLDIDAALFDFLRDVLQGTVKGERETEFIYRFQQFTSPVMAKGVEDTAFYCYNRLTALNEVGGNPDCDGLTLEQFHAYNSTMQRTHPLTMTTLSTHDTKRSDDVRARLLVISEMPEQFGRVMQEWSDHNAKYRTANLPDRGTEWFLYQTLIGAWPISAERLIAYMQKAMREAKTRTSWVANNLEYESALNSFIESVLKDEEFVARCEAFVDELLLAGRVNSLTQTLLKQVSPGVPDMYQGGELWDLSLVDPDNRRPVDYAQRRKLLAQLEVLDIAGVMERMNDGLPKLLLVHRLLKLRRERRELFGPEADYKPIAATGEKANHVIAFGRGDDLIAVAPRHTLTLGGDWQKTSLDVPAGNWRDVLTDKNVRGGTIDLVELLRDFPVALLLREG